MPSKPMVRLGFRRRPPADRLLDRVSACRSFRQMRGPQALVENPREVQRIARADVVVMLRQPVLRRFSAAIPEVGEKGPFGIELAGDAEPEHSLLVVDRMDMHIAEALALEVLVVDDFP